MSLYKFCLRYHAPLHTAEHHKPIFCFVLILPQATVSQQTPWITTITFVASITRLSSFTRLQTRRPSLLRKSSLGGNDNVRDNWEHHSLQSSNNKVTQESIQDKTGQERTGQGGRRNKDVGRCPLKFVLLSSASGSSAAQWEWKEGRM